MSDTNELVAGTDLAQFTDLMRRFGVECHHAYRSYPTPDEHGQWRGTIRVNFDVADCFDAGGTSVPEFTFSATGEFVGLEYL